MQVDIGVLSQIMTKYKSVCVKCTCVCLSVYLCICTCTCKLKVHAGVMLLSNPYPTHGVTLLFSVAMTIVLS